MYKRPDVLSYVAITIEDDTTIPYNLSCFAGNFDLRSDAVEITEIGVKMPNHSKEWAVLIDKM